MDVRAIVPVVLDVESDNPTLLEETADAFPRSAQYVVGQNNRLQRSLCKLLGLRIWFAHRHPSIDVFGATREWVRITGSMNYAVR